MQLTTLDGSCFAFCLVPHILTSLLFTKLLFSMAVSLINVEGCNVKELQTRRDFVWWPILLLKVRPKRSTWYTHQNYFKDFSFEGNFSLSFQSPWGQMSLTCGFTNGALKNKESYATFLKTVFSYFINT